MEVSPQGPSPRLRRPPQASRLKVRARGATCWMGLATPRGSAVGISPTSLSRMLPLGTVSVGCPQSEQPCLGEPRRWSALWQGLSPLRLQSPTSWTSTNRRQVCIFCKAEPVPGCVCSLSSEPSTYRPLSGPQRLKRTFCWASIFLRRASLLCSSSQGCFLEKFSAKTSE